MLLSRFWYGILALLLGGAVFILFIGAQMYNRTGQRAMAEALSADSSTVGWYLNDDARRRSTELIKIVSDPQIRTGLGKVTPEAKPSREVREQVRRALRKLYDDVAPELKFDAMWALDGNGRVIASAGFEHSEDWELGGYSVVADALHGWIRDDAWVWRGRIYRVVARPVEQEVNGEPVGAILGAKIVDDAFARAVSKRTGAAVGFYADGVRVASWGPEGFDKANLDLITQDLKLLDTNKDYQDKGRSEVRIIGEHLGVVYARLFGEAWDLGAGYAVGRLAVSIESPYDFLNKADDSDKSNVPKIFIVLAVVLLAAAGLVFSIFEHTTPLAMFRKEAARLAKGEVDVLAPSKFRGAYKKIAADINDGIEKVAAKGGVPRRAADLQQVLGPLPAQPAMSAFSVPGAGGAEGQSDVRSMPNVASLRSVPTPSPKGPPRPLSGGSGSSGMRPAPQVAAQLPELEEDLDQEAAPVPAAPPAKPSAPARPPPPKRAPAPAAPTPAAAAPADAEPDEGNELVQWQKVYEDFVALKKQCGEPTAGMTFEKFKGTLQRNKDALVQRHGVTRVKFTVYVKDGKASLKASPVK